MLLLLIAATAACGKKSYVPPDAWLTVHAQKDEQDVPRVSGCHGDWLLHGFCEQRPTQASALACTRIGHGIGGSCVMLKGVNAADLLLIHSAASAC